MLNVRMSVKMCVDKKVAEDFAFSKNATFTEKARADRKKDFSRKSYQGPTTLTSCVYY